MKKPGKIIILIVLSLLFLGGGWLTYKHVSSGHNTPDTQKETVQQQAQDNQKKTETNDNAVKGAGQGTYVPPTTANGIELAAKQTSSTQVVVTTKLTGYSDGTCSLTTSNGGKSDAQTAQVIYQSKFSTCAGFTIPVINLGAGTWTLTLSVTSGGTTNQKVTTVTVQ